VSRQDILDLLLPDAAREDRERARRLATALRLFAHAGRGARAEDVESSVDAARLELAAVARKRRVAALAALLHHHLAAHQDPGAFLLWGPAPPAREGGVARRARGRRRGARAAGAGRGAAERGRAAARRARAARPGRARDGRLERAPQGRGRGAGRR
jgi:hypothetical protein